MPARMVPNQVLLRWDPRRASRRCVWRTLPAGGTMRGWRGWAMTRTVIVLAALAALCNCKSDAPKAAHAKAPTAQEWFEIQTEHVRLFTDAGEDEGRQVASQCERLRAALIA